MKTFLVLVLCLTSVFAAPHNSRDAPPGSIWNWEFRSSMLDDFEANLKKMREEFEQLEKSLGSGFNFGNIDASTGMQVFSENGTNLFNLDPSQVKNKTYSDTKIVDGKVVHTEEKVFANGNSVVHFKKVEIAPKGASATPSANNPKKPSGTPSTSSAIPPEITSTPGISNNDLDSEQVDNDEKTKSVEGSIFGDVDPPKDVEEIERIQPLARLSSSFGEIPNGLDESGSLGSGAASPAVDLSGDTKVNDILSENIASGGLIQPEPDAELVEMNSNSINRPTYAPRKPVGSDNPYYYRYVVEP